MRVRLRLSLLAVATAILVAVGFIATGSFAFLGSDFWFSSGLLLLILLALVDQPFFSRDANIFVNGVTGLVALRSVEPVARDRLWTLFFVWSIYLVATSYGLMLVRRRHLPNESRTVRAVTRINRHIGRPQALFSAFFLWGAITQFRFDSQAFRWLLMYWSVFMIVSANGVARSLASIFDKVPTVPKEPVARVRRLIAPRVLELSLTENASQDLVGCTVTVRGRDQGICAEGTIIDDRLLAGLRVARVGLTGPVTGWLSGPHDSASEASVVIGTSIQHPGDLPVSVVDRGSNIQSLHFFVNPQIAMQEGEVVSVGLPAGRGKAYYQAVSAQIVQAQVEDPNSFHEISVVASQLGVWHSGNFKFQPIQWVAPAGELVWRVGSDGASTSTVPSGRILVGTVPNSSFPVHVDIEDLVTHNSAILGVTGVGKSYLSFLLTESLVKQLKVLVLDITRQHWIYLQNLSPTAIKSPAELTAWLNDTKSPIGIYQFADSLNYPKTTADFVETAFQWLKGSVQLKAGANEPARLCIVFEEAHSLVPEWNQVSTKGDEAHVNRTARCILQGRKYGMGSVILSQRTANVTKTILNQCNTIFAFQSFDQTGLDFLKNYLGEEYAHAISTLPARHTIVVGKASSSTRPVIFRMLDLEGRWKPASEPAATVAVGLDGGAPVA